MSATISERDAKEFLVSQIAGEAERQGHPLSDLERKMLYFSESGWTTPDALDVSAAFDREYNSHDYEKTITGLVGAARKRATGKTAALWIRATDKLAEGDHYISIMLGEAHPWTDTGSLIWHGVVLLVVGVVGVAAFNFAVERFLNHTPTREELGFYAWAVALPLTALAWLLHRFCGRKLNGFVDHISGWLLGEPRTRTSRDDESRSSRCGHAMTPLGQLRELVTDALRYWELRRLFYNALLAFVVLGHFIASWPVSRSSVTSDSLLDLFLLAVVANVAYSVVYVPDVFIQFSGFRDLRSRWRLVFVVVASPSPRS